MNIFNILFYSLGIGLPILIIYVALSKKNTKNFLNKFLIAVIIFLIFYIVKVGGINLMDKANDNKDINTTIVDKTTSKNEDNKTISTTTSTTRNTTRTTSKTTIITTKEIASTNNKNIKYVDGILIVNKSYPLPADYVPTNTYKDATGLNYCSNCLDKETYEQYQLMDADATSLGLNLWIQSGYRSYSLQESLYNKYVNRDGKEAADTYSARPGHSEHQTGLAFDLNSITDDFQYTNEGIWVNNNCYKYGFILRYPKGKEHITGYKYEPWHLRYVGIDLAEKLYNNGDWITLEEHFNLTSTYN